MSPDNLKHLSNLLLAQIYMDHNAALALIEHLRDDKDLPKFYLPTLKFYESIVYSLRNDTIDKALVAISEL
jgi:hypothetical protein